MNSIKDLKIYIIDNSECVALALEGAFKGIDNVVLNIVIFLGFSMISIAY